MSTTVRLPSQIVARVEANTVPTTQQTHWLVADATGKLLFSANTPYFMMDMYELQPGERCVQGVGDTSKDWLNGGVVQARPANPALLTDLKISNVPNPSTVTIAGETTAQVTDGEVELEFAQPGTFKVTVQSWPYLDATFTVKVDEATT